MKIQIYLKDPDTLNDAIDEAVEKNTVDTGYGELVEGSIKEELKQEYKDLASTWFEYGEYVMLEIDTDAKTCVVLPVSREK